MMPRSILAASLAASACLWSCAAIAKGGAADAIAAPQSDQEINKMIGELVPTQRVVPNADSKLLWQATSGYMQRAFPLDELPAGVAQGPGGSRQIRTQLVEWTSDGFPHRTRVFVHVHPEPANKANMILRVTALRVEGEPQLAHARQGEPLEYSWRLTGGNPQIEETVAEQILKRYEALRAGKPLPLDEEMIVPVKG